MSLYSPTRLVIKTPALQPMEQATPLKLLRSADVYQQIFVKYSQCGTFHSYAELLHAALLEADATVEMFVPQPFRVSIGSSNYIPDCYFVKNGVRVIREIRSKALFPEEWRAPLTEFWKERGMTFEIISNAEIYARETEALNWLQIVQTLVSATTQDTELIEDDVSFQIARAGTLTLDEILSDGDDFTCFGKLLAVYRLLHRGRLTANLDNEAINYNTEFRHVA